MVMCKTHHQGCGHNHPTVLTPLYIVAHRQRTAKIDLPTLAKVKRSLRKRGNVHREWTDPLKPEPDARQATQQRRPRRKIPTKEQREALRAKYGRPR